MLLAVDALNESGVPWMLTGSFATNLYAVPRFTADADFIIQSTGSTVLELARQLNPQFILEAQTTFETITSTTRHVLRHAKEQFTIEFFELSEDAYDQQRFRRRVELQYHDRTVYIPTAEDVIVNKLHWWVTGRRPKDLDDARNVLEQQQDRLDWDYVGKWCKHHGTVEILNQLRDETKSSGGD